MRVEEGLVGDCAPCAVIARTANVRFTSPPESRHRSARRQCPLVPIGDILQTLFAQAAGTPGKPIRFAKMPESNTSERVRACLDKATECERQALLVTDEAHRKTYLELANLWRDMAQQVQSLHKLSTD